MCQTKKVLINSEAKVMFFLKIGKIYLLQNYFKNRSKIE